MSIEGRTAKLKSFVIACKQRGHVSCEEITGFLPEHCAAESQVDELLSELAKAGIEILEARQVDLEWEADRSRRSPLDRCDDPVDVYLRTIDSAPKLTSEEERDLAQRVAGGDHNAEAALCESHGGLVVFVAKRFADRGVHVLDLIQEGNLGLLKALQRFDYRCGYRFSTYATWWVHRAITQALRAQRSRAQRS